MPSLTLIRRGFALLALVGFFGLGVALPRAARAEPIAVLGLEAVGVPDGQAMALTQALRLALAKRSGVEAMPGKDVMEMRFLFGCTDEKTLGPCLTQAGRTLVAEKLVIGSLRGDSAAAKSSGKAELFLRLLDVETGQFLSELHDPVEPASLAPAAINQAAERWLGLLFDGVIGAHRSATAQAGTPAHRTDEGRGRGRAILYAGIGLAALGLVAGGAAIGTWQHYVALEHPANVELAGLFSENPTFGRGSDAQGFRARPTCSLPDPTLSSDAANNFRRDCGEGATFASVTTALVVAAGVLVAGGATAIVAGSRMGSSVEKKAAAASARLMLLPVVSPAGAGLQASFSF